MTSTLQISPKTSPRTAPKPAAHLGYLDSLRALAAIYVVLHHACLTIFPNVDAVQGVLGPVVRCMRYGPYAVALFIVLSGFCLMLPVARGDGTLRSGAWNFLRRRAVRILPPYYAAAALGMLCGATIISAKTGTLWDGSLSPTRGGIITHLLLLQDLISHTRFQINYPLWSISVEWRIYFLFPLFVFLWRRINPLILTAGIFVGAMLAAKACNRFHGDYLHIHYVGLFALGMFGAYVAFSRDEPAKFLKECFPWKLSFLILIALIWAISVFRILHDSDYPDELVGLCSLCLLVMCAQKSGGLIDRFLSNRFLVFVGGFSYSLYLIHAPLLQMVWQYFVRPAHLPPGVAMALLMGLGVPLILAGSYLFFLICERPFLRKKPVDKANPALL